MPPIWKAGAVYFALTFGVGFVLGAIRELWVTPHLGARSAELVEAPVMLAVSVWAAHWTVRRLAIAPGVARRLGIGLVALALLLVAELAVVLGVRHLSLADYVASRDPVSAGVYLVTLVLFALIPLLVARR